MIAENTSRTDAETLTTVRELAEAARRVRRGSEISARLVDVDHAGRYLGMSDKGIGADAAYLDLIQRLVPDALVPMNCRQQRRLAWQERLVQSKRSQ